MCAYVHIYDIDIDFLSCAIREIFVITFFKLSSTSSKIKFEVHVSVA